MQTSEVISSGLAVSSQHTKAKPTAPVKRAHAIASSTHAPRRAASAQAATVKPLANRLQRSLSSVHTRQAAQDDSRTPSPSVASIGEKDVAGLRRGRTAETSPERLARVQLKRQELVVAIRSKYADAVKRSGKAAAWKTLTPLEQILPSPPDQLIHNMALLWAQAEPSGSTKERGHALRVHLRTSFHRGTELQMLCAMAGLRVLPARDNNHWTMAQSLLSTVLEYAAQWDGFVSYRTDARIWEHITDDRRERVRVKSPAIATTVQATKDRTQLHDVHMYMHNGHMHMNEALRDPPDVSTQSSPIRDAGAMGSSWDFLSAPVPPIGLLPPPQPAVVQDAHPPESALCEPAGQRQQCFADERSAGTTLPGTDAVAPVQAVETTPQQNHGVPLVHHETVVDEGRAQLLLMLHPASPATTTEVLNHSSCPSWVAGALRAIISSLSGGGRAPSAPIAKQRLALAATIALEVTDLMESKTDRAIMQQLGFSPRRLLNDLAGTQVRLGSGLNSGALKTTCKKLGITAPADTEHYSRIDGAYRILLAQLWLGDVRSMQLVRRICERLQQQMMLPLSEDVIPFPVEADFSHPRYVSVAGDGHCLYSCISRAEGITNPDVRDVIRAELESQPSEMPGCLTNINLVDKPEHCIHIVDAKTAHAAKQQSLESRRLNNMWFAGESELLLCAKSTQGAVRFRLLSSSDYNGDGWAKNPRIQVWQVDGSQPTREIILHLCTYNGREGTGLPDAREPAHYNLIMAELADGSTCGHWPIDRSMDGDQAARAATDLRLWQICKASVVQNASRWETKCREEEVKSLQLAHTLQQSAGSAFLKPILFALWPAVERSLARIRIQI